MSEFNAETLLGMGFRDVAFWALKDDAGKLRYEFDGINAEANQSLFDVKNVLYAFIEGQAVKYIGKTTQSLKTRFVGYCKPNVSQTTNYRNNGAIRQIIANGGQVRIYIFTPIPHLSYADFPVNLAAGLEDSLVAMLSPSWNGKSAGSVTAQTESAEIEEERLAEQAPNSDVAAPLQSEADPKQSEQEHEFEIILSKTYFGVGIVNPGIEASRYLGRDGDPVTISFSDGGAEVTSWINRTANTNGSVRFIGNNRLIAEWFQARFKEGDRVRIRILSPHSLLMLGP